MSSADPIAVLSAIVAEVAGHGPSLHAHSFLPPHLIHDAREAIESAVPTAAQDAHIDLLIARLQKADEKLAALRATNVLLEKIVAALTETNAELDGTLEAATSANCELNKRYDEVVRENADLHRKLKSAMPAIPGCPPGEVHGIGHIVFDPYERLTAYGRRQECDE